MINWQYYPKSDVAPQIVATTIAAFESVATQISSESNTLESNAVLEILANRFFDTMYASNRLRLPLKGILVIGY